MKRFLVVAILLAAGPGQAVIIDRIAAVVEQEVIPLSEINQLVTLRFISRNSGESEDRYRRRVLETMIAQALRYRDTQRFGAQNVPSDAVEARLLEIQKRFPSIQAFEEALRETELTLEELRNLITRQLQVEAYVEERFSPLIFVSLDQIEEYYTSIWAPQRRSRGLDVPPLPDVREEIRRLLKAERLDEEIKKWTEQLRSRVNVDIYAW
jgi:peptidyl-prolyl cis-trans isomerase SurA